MFRHTSVTVIGPRAVHFGQKIVIVILGLTGGGIGSSSHQLVFAVEIERGYD